MSSTADAAPPWGVDGEEPPAAAARHPAVVGLSAIGPRPPATALRIALHRHAAPDIVKERGRLTTNDGKWRR